MRSYTVARLNVHLEWYLWKKEDLKDIKWSNGKRLEAEAMFPLILFRCARIGLPCEQ